MVVLNKLMTNFYYSFSFSYSEYYGTNEIKALWDS